MKLRRCVTNGSGSRKLGLAMALRPILGALALACSANALACGRRSDAPKTGEVAHLDTPSSAPAPSFTADASPTPAAPLEDPEASCEARGGIVERRRGWPHAAVADVASGKRSGALEIDARIEDVIEGDDCGGAPTECAGRLRPFRAVVVGDDGARLTLSGPSYERGAIFVVGVRYALSVVVCTKSGSRAIELRGAEALNRAHGTEVSSRDCWDAPPPSPKLESWPSRELPDLARHRVEPGGFNTEGFVVHRYTPTPCPPGAECKPQAAPHIVLGERMDAPIHTLPLYTPDPSAIPLGSDVAVSVVLCGDRSIGGSVNMGKLRAIELLGSGAENPR